MAKIYTNENFPQRVVEALRQLGHDVLTTKESGKAGQAISDKDVLTFAKETGRVLVTFNRRHFVRLHLENPEHAGIIICTIDLDFSGLANRIHAALQAQPEMSGKLLRVNQPAQKDN